MYYMQHAAAHGFTIPLDARGASSKGASQVASFGPRLPDLGRHFAPPPPPPPQMSFSPSVPPMQVSTRCSRDKHVFPGLFPTWLARGRGGRAAGLSSIRCTLSQVRHPHDLFPSHTNQPCMPPAQKPAQQNQPFSFLLARGGEGGIQDSLLSIRLGDWLA